MARRHHPKHKPKRTSVNPHPKGQVRTDITPDPDVDEWLAQRCDIAADLQDRCLNLAASWQNYCDAQGLSPGHVLHLWQQLTLRGFPRARNGHGLATRHGLAVKPLHFTVDNLAISGRA
jgi:hypothetical protein